MTDDDDVSARLASVEQTLAEHTARHDHHDRRLGALEVELSAAPAIRDPIRWRRSQLRRLWHLHYRGMSRSAAAQRIALGWRAYADARANELPTPGTVGAIFAELNRAGVPPMSQRTIQNDLAGD